MAVFREIQDRCKEILEYIRVEVGEEVLKHCEPHTLHEIVMAFEKYNRIVALGKQMREESKTDFLTAMDELT